MEWISGWIQGIIIAVIISTIIEMILPEGTSKKYIKVVIGVYILFSMVSPIITKLTGNSFRVSNILDLDEYIETSSNSKNMQNQLKNQNQIQIKEVYENSIKNDIKEKVENKGYTVSYVGVEIGSNEQYELKTINLQITKYDTSASNSKATQDNNEIVEKVNEIQINNITLDNKKNSNSKSLQETSKKAQKDSISSQAKKELREYLSGVYEISIKNIFINE